MKVGGSPLEDVIAKRMIQVSVTESMDPPNHFNFQLYDPELHLINAMDGRFTEGQEVEIGTTERHPGVWLKPSWETMTTGRRPRCSEPERGVRSAQ